MSQAEPPNVEDDAPDAGVVDPSQKELTPRQERVEKRKQQTEVIKSAHKALNAQYLQIKSSEALQDLQVKMLGFHDYHLKLAQDGVAYESTGQSDKDGEPVMRTIRLTPEERTGHLDKASGIQEIIDYLDRRLALPVKSDI